MPHNAAKDASERMRWGLSPAVINRVAAVSAPTPRAASSAGLARAQRRLISVVSSSISAVSAWYRRARKRRACSAYAVVVGVVPGRKAAQTLTRALGDSSPSWCLTCSGAVTTSACSWLMAWVRALTADLRT